MPKKTKERKQSNSSDQDVLGRMSAKEREMEIQRLAMLNILEDTNEAQNELKKRYAYLEAIKSLTEKLSVSVLPFQMFESAGRAINEIIPNSVCYFYSLELDSSAWGNKIFIYSSCALDDSFIDLAEKNIILTLKKASQERKNRVIDKALFKQKFAPEFLGVIGGREKCQARLKHNSFLLTVSGTIIGVLCVAVPNKKILNQEEYNVINTTANTVAQSLERARILSRMEYSRLNDLVERMSNGVILFDLNRKVLVANMVIKKIAGGGKELDFRDFVQNVTGIKRYFSSSGKTEDIDLMLEIGSTITEDRSVSFEEVEIKGRAYELFITPIKDYKGDVNGGALVVHDITHFREINLMKSEFVSVVSHQLRTPLTSIRLFTEMMMDESVGKMNKTQKEYLDSVYQSSLGMISLVNDLLNLSRIEAGRLEIKPTEVDLNSFIKKIVEGTKILAHEKQVNFFFKGSPKSKIITDAGLLEQVVHNLVVNAINYSSKRKPEIKVSVEKKEKRFLISVADNGIGIPKEAQGRIFEKFFRADNATKTRANGSGLGVYVSKIITERLQGEMWFKSVAGKGTIFTVSLPEKLNMV